MRRAGRKLGFWMALALCVGNTIGSGIFLLPASLAPFGWNGVAGWGITIAGAMCLALTIAALTARLPEAEGPPGQVEAAFGKMAGFMIGWSYWISIWTSLSALGVAAVSYLSVFAPGLAAHPGAWASVILWLLVLVGLGGARLVGQFQMLTTLLKLVPMFLVGLLATIALADGGGHLQPLPAGGLQLAAVNQVATITLFAMLGFESPAAAQHLIENPTRNVPRAMLWGTAIVGAVYLFISSAVVLMLPADAVAASNAPFQLFVSHFWAPGPALFVAAFAAISCIGAMNGWTLLTGEIPWAMAQRGELPAWMGKESRSGMPVNAIGLSCLLATMMMLFGEGESAGKLFLWLALVTTSVTLWLYLGCALAALKFRVAVLPALLGTAYALFALWGAGIGTSALSILLMVSGLPVWWWCGRSRDVSGAAHQPPAP